MLKQLFTNLFHKTERKGILTDPQQREKALSITIMLVDISKVDNSFDYDEHAYITQFLNKLFVVTKDEIYALLAEAEQIVNSNANLDNYATILQSYTNAEEREEFIKIIDSLIAVDGISNQYEVKLRNRYERLLGVKVKPN